MDQYVGLDVSLKDTTISIRQGGRRIWRGKCPSDPKAVAQTIRKHAAQPQKVIFESGPLATWFFHALTEEGLPAICIEARHAQKILSETLNKTDANDADGLAQLAEAGFYKAVRVKSFGAMRIRTLIGARAQFLDMTTQLTNQILKSQSLLSEKLAGVALAAAERSTEISVRWAKDSMACMGELAAVKEEPSDYAKAVSDFASRSAELAAEHMAAYAEVAKKVQMDTVDLMLTAGKDVALDAQKNA